MWWVPILCACHELDGALVVEHLRSDALDTTYQYSTYVHPDAVLEPGAPWLLLTDGDFVIEDAARALDRQVRRGNASPVVLVGIGHEATRDRDLTPMPTTPLDDGDEWDEDWGGGIEPYFTFLHDEVIPKAEGELGIGGAPEDRALFGHSLGGLATLWAATNDRATFGRFAVSSPSLWWDAAAALEWERPASPPITVFATVGTVEVPPMIVLFDAYVEQLDADPAVDLTVHRYRGKDHFSAPTASVEASLGVLFPAGAR